MREFDIRRADDRAVTRTDWLVSRHSFAFGSHYDPDNVSFGPLLAVNADVVQPGPGYVSHRHAGLEILTWVRAGVLAHELAGKLSWVEPGHLQYLSVGRGIEHAERSGSNVAVSVVQMWLAGAGQGPPEYHFAPIPAGQWVLAASGQRPAPIRLRHARAELWRSVLEPGATIALPAESMHLLVLSGTVRVDGESLEPEDALRGRAARLSATTAAELLVWTFG